MSRPRESQAQVCLTACELERLIEIGDAYHVDTELGWRDPLTSTLLKLQSALDEFSEFEMVGPADPRRDD